MQKIKKFLSFLTLTSFIGLVISSTFISLDASAFDLDDLFEAGNQGQTFEDFAPVESLTLESDGFNESLTTSSDLREFVIRVVNFALGFLGLVAVIIVIYGGVRYVTAGGQEEATQTGKKAILYATIGLIIVMGSFAFVNTVIQGAGGEDPDSGSAIGANTGGSFNAAATQVRSLAKEVYESFLFFAEANEDMKNMLIDLEKDSLSYKETLVSKQDMLNYIYSAKDKLLKIRQKVNKFSEVYLRINSVLSYLDIIVDKIHSEKFKAWVRTDGTGKISVCSQDYLPLEDGSNDETIFEDAGEAIGDFFAENFWQSPWCSHNHDEYLIGLWVIWARESVGFTYVGKNADAFQAVFESQDEEYVEGQPPSLRTIVPALKQAHLNKVLDVIEQLEEIRALLVGIEAVDQGDIGKIYQDMLANYGYNPLSPTSYSTYLKVIEDWSLSTEAGTIEEAGQALYLALEKQLEFADELAKLQSVQARLRANVVEGNAPLVVTFDVLETLDPAGGSISADNIVWDLKGEYTFEDIAASTQEGASVNKSVTLGTDVVECDERPTNTDADAADSTKAYDKFFGSTYKQCIFHQPGTYIATVIIHSNDRTQFVSGQSSLIIKVNPPTNKIDLDVTLGTESPIEIISYYPDSGVKKVDKKYLAITKDQATNVKFDATGTNSGTGIKEYKWDFDGGIIVSEGQNEESATNEQSGIVNVIFEEYRKYTVTLEVINESNEVDRKILIVDVRDVAARIKITPSGQAYINRPVIFDGTQSKATGGKIKSYEWTITNQNDPEAPAIELEGGNVNYKFPDPGVYEVILKVTSDFGEDVTPQPEILVVISEPPEPLLDFEFSDPTQPGTVYLSAERSFDPDGEKKDLIYEWQIEPKNSNNTNFGDSWQFENPTGPADKITGMKPVIKFKKKGDYEVTLKVCNGKVQDKATGEYTECEEITETISVENILDIAWAEGLKVVENLDEEGKATLNIAFESDAAQDFAYEIDFGDESDEESGTFTGSASVPHTYTEAGKFNVTVTIFDEEDNDNSISRRFFVGGGEKPIARGSIFVNGVEIFNYNPDNPETYPVVSKKDIITFDASDSINTDGTGKKLSYSWDFGDTNKSSQKSATHSYKELSAGTTNGYFTAKLTVFDKDDPALASEPDVIYIKVENKPPKISSIQAVPDTTSSDLITPASIDLKVFGAEDPDGEIVQYKWWYFDVDDPDERKGIQVTKTPNAKLVIGTSGKEGLEREYGFGLEVTDSDNITLSTEDALDESQIPTVEVVNGPNDLPIAKFSVNSTKVFVGDTITFSSASTDPDGQIVDYIWDLEGDGFYNNEPSNKANLEHKYELSNLNGYQVRLKVIDDKGGESISQPITVYVESLAEPPVAAFNFQVVPASQGKKIKFTNNSKADEDAGAKIIKNEWDFDTKSNFPSADSDGDGNIGNDVESTAKDPEFTYSQYSNYTVQLTVTDSHGNTDSVTKSITIPLANPPTAAFTYEIADYADRKVIFKNNSTSDSTGGATLIKYEWDFDTASTLQGSDSDGDGDKTNDIDSQEKAPTHQFELPGVYSVKLTVYDSQGNVDEVINTVSLTLGDGQDGGSGTNGDNGGKFISKPGPNIEDALEDTESDQEYFGGTGANPNGDGSNAGSTTNTGNLFASMVSTPNPSDDGIIYLNGDSGSVTFNFAGSTGSISQYIFDKNIYFDTDGNGTKNDDQDFKTILPGTWTTNFEKAWGKTMVKLTVTDIYGNQNSITQEIKFK